jgi:hypothetical protein
MSKIHRAPPHHPLLHPPSSSRANFYSRRRWSPRCCFSPLRAWTRWQNFTSRRQCHHQGSWPLTTHAPRCRSMPPLRSWHSTMSEPHTSHVSLSRQCFFRRFFFVWMRSWRRSQPKEFHLGWGASLPNKLVVLTHVPRQDNGVVQHRGVEPPSTIFPGASSDIRMIKQGEIHQYFLFQAPPVNTKFLYPSEANEAKYLRALS